MSPSHCGEPLTKTPSEKLQFGGSTSPPMSLADAAVEQATIVKATVVNREMFHVCFMSSSMHSIVQNRRRTVTVMCLPGASMPPPIAR
jgi:hypothetical protein